MLFQFSNKNYGMHNVCFIDTPFGTLGRQVEKLACLWHVGKPSSKTGTFIGTLVRKNEELARFCHVSTWAHRNVARVARDLANSIFSSKYFFTCLVWEQ